MEIRATPTMERWPSLATEARIGVMHEVYILLVYRPRSDVVCARWESRRPWLQIRRGDHLRAGGLRLRVTLVTAEEVVSDGGTQHRTHAYTDHADEQGLQNVVPLPRGARSPISDIYRYHVLMRIFDGDADRWLEQLVACGRAGSSEARFARWVRRRLKRDPQLIHSIRKLVDAVPIEYAC